MDGLWHSTLTKQNSTKIIWLKAVSHILKHFLGSRILRFLVGFLQYLTPKISGLFQECFRIKSKLFAAILFIACQNHCWIHFSTLLHHVKNTNKFFVIQDWRYFHDLFPYFDQMLGLFNDAFQNLIKFRYFLNYFQIQGLFQEVLKYHDCVRTLLVFQITGLCFLARFLPYQHFI